LRYVLVAVAAASAFALAGCSPSSPADEGTIKPGSGVALNPSGAPQNANQAAYAAEMQKSGNNINAERQKDAAAMEAARNKAGGN
jgi:ABC-type oligopeptide transport system substrate-binding subunit